MIYVAGPFFTKEEREALEKMIHEIRNWYHDEELFIPMEHFIPNGNVLPNNVWSEEVFKMDIEAIQKCRLVFAMYTGHYSDTGTAWEIGYAYALKKPVMLYIPQKYKRKDMSIMPINSTFAWNFDVSTLNQK